MNGCIFCKISNGEISVKKIFENENFFSIPDANPRTDGHSLIISKKHFETFLDLPSEIGNDLIDCIQKTAEVVMKENSAEGFNIVNNNSKVAGQLVEHVHFHFIPRKEGDGLNIM